MYSARATFTFPEGTKASARFALLSELAAHCEGIDTPSDLPAFEIAVKTNECSVVCYMPDKWQAAASFLKLALARGAVSLLRSSGASKL